MIKDSDVKEEIDLIIESDLKFMDREYDSFDDFINIIKTRLSYSSFKCPNVDIVFKHFYNRHYDYLKELYTLEKI